VTTPSLDSFLRKNGRHETNSAGNTDVKKALSCTAALHAHAGFGKIKSIAPESCPLHCPKLTFAVTKASLLMLSGIPQPFQS
jgi:hypothetical protein